jgi:magnesium-transporting ATPase (P-type)
MIRQFLINMAVCHAVETPELMPNGKYEYKAQSPDEKALCEGGETNGYVFIHRTPKEGVTYRDHNGIEFVAHVH